MRDVGYSLTNQFKISKLIKKKDMSSHVTTLTLGSRPKQGLARGQDKRETWEAHLIFPRVQESVRK